MGRTSRVKRTKKSLRRTVNPFHESLLMDNKFLPSPISFCEHNCSKRAYIFRKVSFIAGSHSVLTGFQNKIIGEGTVAFISFILSHLSRHARCGEVQVKVGEQF